jgi:hypothetical protein
VSSHLACLTILLSAKSSPWTALREFPCRPCSCHTQQQIKSNHELNDMLHTCCYGCDVDKVRVKTCKTYIPVVAPNLQSR